MQVAVDDFGTKVTQAFPIDALKVESVLRSRDHQRSRRYEHCRVLDPRYHFFGELITGIAHLMMRMMSADLEFHCNLKDKATPLPHFWEHTVGSCHANLALRSDWQRQIQRCHQELGFRYVRFHGLLCDDVGLLIQHHRKPLYSFFNADQIFDFLLSIGMRPFVELSFMPRALASGHATVFHYRGNITPPRDYRKWAALIFKLVSHLKRRYGAREVGKWFFEVWNEPNLKAFWAGSQKAYFHLYRVTAEAIKKVDPHFRVGGPATAKNAWIPELLDFCDRTGTPLDFISTHHYPTDASGNESMDTITQLATSRRSILREQIQAARTQSRGFSLYYTEWNTSSNSHDPMHDEPYAAAFIIKTIFEANGFIDGYSFWTFSDIFEEDYFPSIPFHGGFGLLNILGIPKPSYRAFELLHAAGGELCRVDGIHETVDAWVVRGDRAVKVFLTNQALPRSPIRRETVRFSFTNASRPARVFVERIDERHANAKAMWVKMGSPEYLKNSDLSKLQEASRVRKKKHAYSYRDNMIHTRIDLPPYSVAVITLEHG